MFFQVVDVLLVDVLFLERVDLLLDQEDLDELGEFALEGVEHREDGVDVLLEEVEVGVVVHLVVACVLVELVVVGGVEVDALLEDLDQALDGRVFPDVLELGGVRVDEAFAAGDHLVGQFAEQL